MNKLAYLLLLLTAAAGKGVAPDTPPVSAAVPLGRMAPRHELSISAVRWTLVGGDSPREVVSGRTTPVTLRADIAKGWHIYSLTQKPGGPIPLNIRLVGAGNVVIRGLINAPKPERTFDKNFGIETEVYSGNPRFTIPIGVTGRSLTGIRRFQIAAHYQVCSATLCLPARTDRVDVALRIRGRK
jgi:DsbC/DsbD-like thiol-disulfide interchange protein